MRCLTIALLASFISIAASAQCTSVGLAVVVSKSNPTDNLSMAQLRKLLLGDVFRWPDRKPVSVISRDGKSAVFKCVLSALVRMSDSEYRRYLSNSDFRGEQSVRMKTVDSDGKAAQAAGSPGAIAVIEGGSLAAIPDSVKVIRINGKHPGEPGYPL